MDSLRTHDPSSRPASVPNSSPSPQTATPTNDDIEAVIQMATSARPSPDGRTGPLRDTRTQLFVGNLPYRVRWQDLKDLFRKAGTVLRADVSLGPDNRSRGYGTVLLATAEDAGRAIDMYNGYSWQTRILEVRADRLPPDFENPLGPLVGAGVGGLGVPPPSVAMGATPYGGAGGVQSSPQGQGQGMMSISGLTAAMGDEFDYNSLFERPGSSGNGSSGCRNLFVGNLPFHCQWQDLKDLFRQAGTIIRADVALGQDGRSRGFGTVVFATELDAERAVKMFNAYEYNGRSLKVHYDKFSQSSQPTTTPASPAPLHSTFQHSVPSLPSSTPTLKLAKPHHHQPPPFGTHQPPTHITMPGYSYDLGTSSGPSSPFEMYPNQMQMQMQMHALQQHQQQQQERAQEQEWALQEHKWALHVQQGRARQEAQERSSAQHHPGLDVDNLLKSLVTTHLSPPNSNANTGVNANSSSTSGLNPGSISLNTSLPTSSSGSTSNSSKATPTSPERSDSHSRSPPQPQSQQPPQTQSQSQSQSQSQLHSHPHHPGPISLPPPPSVTAFPVAPHSISPHGMSISVSPLHHPMSMSPLHHPHHMVSVPITPHGLPPITPSMPPFTFLPQPSPHQQHSNHTHSHPHTNHAHPQNSDINSNSGNNGNGHHHPSHLNLNLNLDQNRALPSPTASVFTSGMPSSPIHPSHTHALSTFSPGVAMSPGAFWGRPGGANPFINPAVGAPVHVHSPGHGGFFYPVSPGSNHGGGGGGIGEPAGYFDPGYFPPMGASGLGASGLANEILRERKEGEGWGVVGGEKERGWGEPEDVWEEDRKDGDGEGEGEGEGEVVESSPSEVGTGDSHGGLERVRRHSSSTATSWHTNDGDIKSWMGDGEVVVDDDDDDDDEAEHGKEHEGGNGHPRTFSMSSSSKRPPGLVLVHRPDSDPVPSIAGVGASAGSGDGDKTFAAQVDAPGALVHVRTDSQ